MIIELRRDANPQQKHNFGKLFVDGIFYGETLEDPEQKEKIYGETAIPRGRYRVALTPSRRFGRVMPEVLDVPGFNGIRIHGGNTEHDTLGCPLLGQVRTPDGIKDCKGVNERLYYTLLAAKQREEEVWLEVT